MNKLNVLNVSDANKFAFIKGNRPTDEKAIKVKKDSISEHGILCPKQRNNHLHVHRQYRFNPNRSDDRMIL